jgi:hypothetical protein
VVKTLITMRLLCAALAAVIMACALSLPVPRQEQLVAQVDVPQGPAPSMETVAVRELPPQVKEVVVKVTTTPKSVFACLAHWSTVVI